MRIRIVTILFLAVVNIPLLIASSALSKEAALPDYLEQANAQVTNAAIVGTNLDELADDILIARNTIRNALNEYENNLGAFSGKLDKKAEPKVRHLAEMASLQAALITSKANAINNNRERLRLEGLVLETKAKIKIFDDLTEKVKSLQKLNQDQASQISGLNAKLASLNAELAAKGSVISSSDQKTADLLKALEEQKLATASAERRVAALSQENETLKNQLQQLRSTSDQLAAERRIKSFEAEIGKMGGLFKASPGVLSVTFPRSQMLKVTGRSTTITAAGEATITKIADLLKTYPEYRLKIRVHGFGPPTRNEDAASTDQMARFVREALLNKGKFEPATVEALGIGAAEPIYPKKNVEGNRRIEFVFLKH